MSKSLKTKIMSRWKFKVLQLLSILLTSFFKKKIGGHKSFLWGHWYPCFELLVTSPLCFKARVSSLICIWLRHTCYMLPVIHLWFDTCWPLGCQLGSQAVLFHVHVSRHWWGSKLGSTVPPLTVWDQTGRRTLYWLGHTVTHLLYP